MTADKREGGVGGYILVGGGSTRFGRDKALVEIGGRPMLARIIELMQTATEEVKLVALPGKYHGYDVEIVADQWPGEGPLGGIVTALEDAAKSPRMSEWNLMVSCDMPFLTNDWLKFMCGRAEENKAQVVLPHSAWGPEPLCACYRTDGAGALRAAFESGVRKVTEGLKHVTTEVLDEKDWKRFDSAGRLFWNMNTLADYEEARRVLDAGER
jgi:molybdopterin-guanine dinucleotide biosynthesis protein A